jgi:hypothetical protein
VLSGLNDRGWAVDSLGGLIKIDEGGKKA